MEKYRMLRDFLLQEKILTPKNLVQSPLARKEDLALAHSWEFIEQVEHGTLPIEMIKRIGFPWSFDLYQRSRATVGGAIGAARAALEDGVAGNLAGGTHHAHADRGEGYCVFNDLAVATRLLLRENHAKRIAIIDLDVHQGNGNSSILGQDSNVFVFSMHGEKNYPFKKVPSHLDIALPNDTGDVEFLQQLNRSLPLIEKFGPDFVFYQAGVDPLKEDRLGKLALTHQGLWERDQIVLSWAKRKGLPISLALGGGYANPIELSVQAYANTYRAAQAVFSSH